MDITNLLINFAKPETGSWLVNIVLWLVTITSSVTVGVLLFTFLLKLITLPFDFISRASMRKNSIIMEEMRPELEKLQKQYADNKDLYNQKMMALYKKNGYSMMSSCLPTILTLVIFIVAINAFTNYSKWQNRMYFYEMSNSYNSVIYDGIESDGEFIIKNEDGSIYIEDKKIYDALNTPEVLENKGIIADIVSDSSDENIKYLVVSTADGYISYRKPVSANWDGKISYHVIEENLSKTFPEYKVGGEVKADEFLKTIARERSADCYDKSETGFIWVKNIWVTDSPFAHPIESSWDKFKTTHSYPTDAVDLADKYPELIYNLEKEQKEANGYFILVILTAGVSLLTQFVIKKTQKAQMELQTVDGQGAQTQKVMTYMMPIMMAVFAFLYTAAFSIYIIVSSILGLGQTFLINFIVDRKFKKKKAEEKKTVVRGRVYVPKEKPENKAPTKKEKVREVPKTGDFLAGTADKNYNRKK